MTNETEREKLGSLSPEAAILILRGGEPLVGYKIDGILDLNLLKLPQFDYAVLEKSISIHKCQIEILRVDASFNAPVEIEDCRFKKIQFYSCFFTKGLTISGCTCEGPFDFLWGGHNRDHPIVFEDCKFEGFVDFDDCWFMGPVIFRNVRFEMGSDLFALDGMPTQVKFDVPLLLENVHGDLRTFGRGLP